MLEEKQPREQSGRDSFGRFKAQARSAAMASLSILEGNGVEWVFCDIHDDFVVKVQGEQGLGYIFYQVKTKGKQNYNWTLNDVFGINAQKSKSKQSSDKIKDSFVGKLLLHTVVFDSFCNSVVFQTNINNHDDIDELLADIKSGKFANEFNAVLIERFNECFPSDDGRVFTDVEIKRKLSKLCFETDVQFLKAGDHNFEPMARDKIYRYSEVDLEHEETRLILMKLLELVERKSCGVLTEITKESLEERAGISIDDLLSVLSISKDAYYIARDSGDGKAIKNVSIIQRALLSAGASSADVEYCSRCKTNWDLWFRKNRHIIPEFDLQVIASKLRDVLNNGLSNNSISISKLSGKIKQLFNELKTDGIEYDLSEELLLGGLFGELVKGKS